MNNMFQKVYPFTTETINGYLKDMNVENKSVLTVGSSLDQALNAVFFDAKEVSVIDINKTTPIYLDKKIEKLLQSDSTEEFYYKVLNELDIPFTMDEVFSLNSLREMNSYMKSEEDFKNLKSKIGSSNISFIEGSIFDFDDVLKDKMYDRILFSNVLQYLKLFNGKKDIMQFLKGNFISWDNHLNKEGILELIYIYNNCIRFDGFKLSDMIIALHEYKLDLLRFKSMGQNDSVILYEKKK